MGKATKWFRNLLGLKKPDPAPKPPPQQKDKRRWSFVQSYREKDPATTKQTPKSSPYVRQHEREPVIDSDPDKHAIAVAAATAAVADAAVAAAQAAEAVVKLTSSSGREPAAKSCSGGGGVSEYSAAIKIQSAFRGYLARRALRALKGLVKLQALVRGHIERKRTTEWLRRMQALMRAQAHSSALRSQNSESPLSSSKSHHSHFPGPPTPEKLEHVSPSQSSKSDQTSILKKNGSRSNGRTFDPKKVLTEEQSWDISTRTPAVHERADKILEVDTGKPRSRPKQRNIFHSTHLAYTRNESHNLTYSNNSNHTFPSPVELQSFPPELEECSFTTAENSPQFYSASSRGGSSKRTPFTPAKSDGAKSCLNGYSDHPNYMSYTESSRAKVRSVSAPRQRPTQYERTGSAKRHSVFGFSEPLSNPRRSSLHSNFAVKGYPGSGRLDKLGMPIGQRY